MFTKAALQDLEDIKSSHHNLRGNTYSCFNRPQENFTSKIFTNEQTLKFVGKLRVLLGQMWYIRVYG